MELQPLIDYVSSCLQDGCSKPLGQSGFEAGVFLAFCFFNITRVFTYLPTIKKLSQPGCTGDGQSLLTWVTWILANSTLCLHLYVIAGYHMSVMVWINLANTVMCLWCAWLVFKVQKRDEIIKRYLGQVSSRSASKSSTFGTSQSTT